MEAASDPLEIPVAVLMVECWELAHTAPALAGVPPGDWKGSPAAGGGDPQGWSARISIEARDAADAVAVAAALVTRLAADVGLPGWPVVRAEAVREDVLDEDLARPQLPHLHRSSMARTAGMTVRCTADQPGIGSLARSTTRRRFRAASPLSTGPRTLTRARNNAYQWACADVTAS